MLLIRLLSGEFVLATSVDPEDDLFFRVTDPFILHVNLKDRNMMVVPILPFMEVSQMVLARSQIWGTWLVTEKTILDAYAQAKSPIQLPSTSIVTK